MLKVLIAGLLGTVAGIAVMVVVIVATGSTTDNSSSVGLNPSVSTAALSTPASSAPVSTPGGSSGGSSSGATGDATAGKAVFASNGCGSCHTLSAAGATGTIGPDLDKAVSGDAQKDKMPLAAFIKQSITDPAAFTASGGPWSTPMPTTFGSSLSPTQIDDLVALIESSQSS
ncbi:MAG TPA: cytochrome c [Gaiellales bacterium]|jgi:cytochrome c551/c552|nr:cytochrome c [Gaiellales bacterium]